MNDEVLHSFEEWWSITGSKIAWERPAEFDAWRAGAEWQRERDAEYCETHAVALDTRKGYVAVEPIGRGGMFEGQFYAEQIRKGGAA